MSDDIETMNSPEFAERCKSVADDLRAGRDVSIEETADRLGLSVEFLMTCAAAWTATQAGQTVMIVPVADKGKAH